MSEENEAKVNSWKSKLEELEVQLSLGQKEAEDFFHEKKDQFLTFIDNAKQKINDLDDIGDEKTEKLKTKLEELKLKLALGKAEAADTWHEQSDKIEATYDAVVNEMKELKTDTSSKVKEIGHDFDIAAEDFKTRFDTYRVQLNLARSDAKDALLAKKAELETKIAETKAKVQAAKVDASEKWSEFSTEVTEAFDHIKAGFRNLFK